jgi:hypothetical protein
VDLITRSDDERLKCTDAVDRGAWMICLRDSLRAALAQLAEKEAQLCKAGELLAVIYKEPQPWSGYKVDGQSYSIYTEIKAALTSSTPCPHAKEAERLREAIQWIDDRWASGVFHPTHDFNELRRRARGGGVSTNDMDNPFYDNHIFISWDTRRWKLTWLDRVKIFFHPTYVQINEGYIFYFKMVDGKYYILKYEPFTPDAGKE